MMQGSKGQQHDSYGISGMCKTSTTSPHDQFPCMPLMHPRLCIFTQDQHAAVSSEAKPRGVAHLSVVPMRRRDRWESAGSEAPARWRTSRLLHSWSTSRRSCVLPSSPVWQQ